VADALFLTLAEVIEIHADQIHRYGGLVVIGEHKITAQALPEFPDRVWFQSHRLVRASLNLQASHDPPPFTTSPVETT
jgi:hypothetical protein